MDSGDFLGPNPIVIDLHAENRREAIDGFLHCCGCDCVTVRGTATHLLAAEWTSPHSGAEGQPLIAFLVARSFPGARDSRERHLK